MFLQELCLFLAGWGLKAIILRCGLVLLNNSLHIYIYILFVQCLYLPSTGT